MIMWFNCPGQMLGSTHGTLTKLAFRHLRFQKVTYDRGRIKIMNSKDDMKLVNKAGKVNQNYERKEWKRQWQGLMFWTEFTSIWLHDRTEWIKIHI